MVGRHLDVVAEHIVVPDLQRADAGLLDQPALQAEDHAPRFGRQPARLVELAVVAFAHEAAVALQQRQLVGRAPARDARRNPWAAPRSPSAPRPSSSGSGTPANSAAISPAARKARAQRAEVARAAAVERQPGQRARHVGDALQRQPQRFAELGLGDEEADRIQPPVDRRPDRSAARSAGRRACRAPAPVTVRSIARNSEPSRLPDSVRISSRLARVAGSMNSVEPFSSRSGKSSGGRSAFCVFST